MIKTTLQDELGEGSDKKNGITSDSAAKDEESKAQDVTNKSLNESGDNASADLEASKDNKNNADQAHASL